MYPNPAKNKHPRFILAQIFALDKAVDHVSSRGGAGGETTGGSGLDRVGEIAAADKATRVSSPERWWIPDSDSGALDGRFGVLPREDQAEKPAKLTRKNAPWQSKLE